MKTIFVSLDTLGANRPSCLQADGVPTPTLDRLAREGALFTKAFATDIPTQPSHTGLFTGRMGLSTGIVSHFHPPAMLDEGIPWLPSLMRDAGCSTGAVDHLFSMKAWFIRGYEDYMVPDGRSRAPGSVINGLAQPWLDAHAHEDFFLFLHFWDAHIPYVPPEPFRSRYTKESATWIDPDIDAKLRSRPSYPLFKLNNYDHIGWIPNLDYLADLQRAEVAYLDFELGRLVDHLDGLGILDDTVLVLFGDHGEVMVEHDAWFDHAGLYDSVTHVPLIIRAPGRMPAAQVDDLVALIDVMPTVLELTGQAALPDLDGRSLLPLVRGEVDGHREEILLSECTWQAKRGLRTERWKYITSHDPGIYPRAQDELYDLPVDPTEQHNLAEERPDVVARLRARLLAGIQRHLGERPDPMIEVIDTGLPAVQRLAATISAATAHPAALGEATKEVSASTSAPPAA